MKLDMGNAWRDAMAMLLANREVMLIVAGVFFFLPGFAAVLLVPEMQTDFGANPDLAQEMMLNFYSANAHIFLLMGLVQAVGLLALLALLRDDSKPTVGEALKIGLFGLLPYMASQLLIAVGLVAVIMLAVVLPVSAGMGPVGALLGIAAVPVAIYVLVKVSLCSPVIAIEKVMNPITVIKRSWQLTKGNSFRLFLYYLLLFVAFLVITIVVSMVFGIIFALLGTGTAFQIANGIFSGLLGAIATMVIAAVIAAVHRQLAGPSASNLSETFS